MGEPDIFDIAAKRTVEAHKVPQRIASSLAKHIANEFRYIDKRAREEIQADLRRLLNVPSEDDVHRIAESYATSVSMNQHD